MKVIAKEMFLWKGGRVRPGAIIEWDPKIPVPACAEIYEADESEVPPEKVRKKPGPKPKAKEPETFAEINADNARHELKPWAARPQ